MDENQDIIEEGLKKHSHIRAMYKEAMAKKCAEKLRKTWEKENKTIERFIELIYNEDTNSELLVKAFIEYMRKKEEELK